ncbi:hypothetical protein [Halobacillus karajensis]|uniref:Uncharacterized protein n=1 Tax=Halobacillus karajensis TaxID=195088 RepID=A0A024P9X7_9BACI|nr:hypothetical protein [Halobacillus karajensis]CDQ20125.1 hypothetical protein BN982_02442 [Halobacillus karajensis]CDQ25212.1 hypothetical protein BN983_03523 [Halobacillus karajensis]CDQ28427.1 hypothetical protein BN981_02729 [Halobacillus karajensis]
MKKRNCGRKIEVPGKLPIKPKKREKECKPEPEQCPEEPKPCPTTCKCNAEAPGPKPAKMED